MIFFVFLFFFGVCIVFVHCFFLVFFFALNSASTKEDIGRPCASAIFALDQKTVILNSLENVEKAHSHGHPFCSDSPSVHVETCTPLCDVCGDFQARPKKNWPWRSSLLSPIGVAFFLVVEPSKIILLI